MADRMIPLKRYATPQPIPDDFKFEWYGDEGLTEKTTDPYGSHLTFIRAFEAHKLDAANLVNGIKRL